MLFVPARCHHRLQLTAPAGICGPREGTEALLGRGKRWWHQQEVFFFFLEKSSLPAFRLEEVGKEEDGMVEAGCRKGPAFK